MEVFFVPLITNVIYMHKEGGNPNQEQKYFKFKHLIYIL